jgi:MFS transporter, putative metabolite:H+ symporter
MSSATAATITARLDRLPATRQVWVMVILLSLGGFFEFYDLFFTGYVVPGLVREGLLRDISVGIFTGPAVFPAATFAGLFIGTLVFGFVADKYGRRSIFTFSLLWYCLATVVMAFQSTGVGVVLWRLIASVGIGVELVTIDTYIAELVPKDLRGRAFAVNQMIQFSVVPVVALLAYLLVPIDPFGFAGWRWVVLIGSSGAIVVWFIRLRLPESPRWLIQHGRVVEAEKITAQIEAAVQRDLGGAPLPPVIETVAVLPVSQGAGSFSEIFAPAFRARTIMLMVFQFFQAVGFYGFANWVPTLIAQQGINLSKSLLYSFVIAIANPFGPLLAFTIADKIELKWILVTAAFCIGVFGMLFALQHEVPLLILFGVLITLANAILSFSFHAYQTELFPTRIRARAVGFTYAFSRISTVFVSFMIGFFLQTGGVTAVFTFIGMSMVIVIISVGVFGPRTRNLQLERISH